MAEPRVMTRIRWCALTAMGAALVIVPASAPSRTPHGPGRPAALLVPTVSPTGASTNLPNIVLIMTDDQRTDTMQAMPSVRRLLERKGVRFTNAMLPTSFCCPSRASTLTGFFGHTTGVLGNEGHHGGWTVFHRNGWERRTLATALHPQGYHTVFIGKYLNGFGRSPAGYQPPGWDYFLTFRGQIGAYYRYRLSDGSWHGRSRSAYSTYLFTRRAVAQIRDTPADQPLFLYFAPFAPHAPFVPAPRDVRTWHGRLAPYRPAASTEDVADKPTWVQALPPVPQAKVDRVHERQLETLGAVDDGVRHLVQALARAGRLHRTLFIFTSDNGYLWGEHHLCCKNVPYRWATKVPLLMRWDGHLRAGTVNGRLALNVDLTASILRAAGLPNRTAGLDLRGRRTRAGFVLEAVTSPHGRRPAYCGWRTHRYMYVRYATGQQELYDYRHDPQELRNLASSPQQHRRLLRLRARAVRQCAPTPPGFHW